MSLYHLDIPLSSPNDAYIVAEVQDTGPRRVVACPAGQNSLKVGCVARGCHGDSVLMHDHESCWEMLLVATRTPFFFLQWHCIFWVQDEASSLAHCAYLCWDCAGSKWNPEFVGLVTPKCNIHHNSYLTYQESVVFHVFTTNLL
jgi:hypothetical protein